MYRTYCLNNTPGLVLSSYSVVGLGEKAKFSPLINECKSLASKLIKLVLNEHSEPKSPAVRSDHCLFLICSLISSV